LRKTYHMIDTCDSSIACWSEDGETFVVKNTDVFEKTVIPQFFKHSKFSSFVRQLNFYGFRKIKYADTIKIDAKLEAETANFWRFRHDKFQRGKPELLIEIKRSNGQQQQNHQQQQPPNGSTTNTTAGTASSTSVATGAAPAPVLSEKKEEVGVLKSEVTSLKKRIELMTKNMDILTTLVSKVTIRQEQQDTSTKVVPSIKQEEKITNVGMKRKNVDVVVSANQSPVKPDGALSSSSAMDTEEEDLKFSPCNMFPIQQAPKRETSNGSQLLSDDQFVDQLFTAFGAEDPLPMALDEPSAPAFTPDEQLSNSTLNATHDEKENTFGNNRPDPDLMDRLSDALTMLPRDVQGMIVDRLIKTITDQEALTKNVEEVTALSKATLDESNIIETCEIESSLCAAAVPQSPQEQGKKQLRQEQVTTLPLAAATLAAMLNQYSCNAKSNKIMIQKSLPIIPMHA